MEDPSSGSIRRISITKLQRETPAGAGLIALCQTVTADGRLTLAEVGGLRDWLATNKGVDLSAISFLYETVERVLLDGVITREEVNEVYRAIEDVLPPDIRISVRRTRLALKLQDQELKMTQDAALKDERRAAKEASRAAQKEEEARRQRSEPLEVWDFMVAGVLHEGRERIVRAYVSPDDTVYLIRDRENRFSRHAVEVRLANGMQIGFVPEDFAREIAPLLDKGLPHAAFIKKVLTGERAPIPVISAGVFNRDADRDDLVLENQVPARTAPPALPPKPTPASTITPQPAHPGNVSSPIPASIPSREALR